MATRITKNRIRNENFFDEFAFFDEILAEHLKVTENGVKEYVNQMKHAVIDVRDVLPEWDLTIARLNKMQDRYDGLKNIETSFDDFQGKDEDVVWIRVFLSKLDQGADPLTKYSKLVFTYKKRKKTLMQKLKEMFGAS
jgi:hypothetical protein